VTPTDAPYCRVCKTALHIHTAGATGAQTYLHALPPADRHDPDPATLAELPDALMRCDFCMSAGVRWLYQTADITRAPRIVTSETVGAGDYRDRHHAARVRSVETQPGLTSHLGEVWAACDPCTNLIEADDLLGLMRRAIEALPPKATNTARKLRDLRGQMHAVYEPLLRSLSGRTAVPARPPEAT